MRPVRLDIDGFASFREPATIDFTDTDYFVMVGPTGSGKSTVIDALTFALYGSVPRWSDRRAVSYGLAPTSTRGTVRLIFDAAGQRYAVARELRRTKTGVGVRNARLDIYADAATTDFDADITNVAADGLVSPAVERLLGLTFDHFCQCVVLPQGQFSDFLRANRKQRQEILLNLLGADLYEKIRALANQRAALASSRTKLLDDQLLRLGDATDQAVDVAASRVEALTAFGSQVDAQLDQLAAAQVRLSGARDALAGLNAELRLLGGVRTPDGLAVVESARTAAAGDLAVARNAMAAAETADTAARTALADGPQRAALERLLDDHHRYEALTAEVPGLASDAATTAKEQAAADVVREQTSAEVVAARTARDAAVRDAEAAATAVQTVRAELELLGPVVVPGDVAELDARERAARAALDAATEAVTQADLAERQAEEALRELPARAPLEQTLARHQDLTAANQQRKALTRSAESAAAALAMAERATSTADDDVATRKAAVDHARNENTAATLRPLLVVGDACPVCDQPVHDLPAALDAAGLSDAETALRTAEQALANARRIEATAIADDLAARARLGDVDATIAELHDALDGQPDEPSVVAALADLASLTDETAAAQKAVRKARDDERVAQKAAELATRSTTAAWNTLRSTRETVLALKPPPVDGLPLFEAWQRLMAWAEGQTAARADRLPEVEKLEAATATARDAAEGDLHTAQRALDDAQTAVTEATSLARLAAERHRRAEADLAALTTRLASEPTAAQAEADLARLTTLEITARAADAALLAARKAVADAQTRDAEAARRYETAWSELRTARDALVPLGAPAVTGQSVSEAWTSLIRWAVQARTARETRLDAARIEADAVEQEVDDVEQGLRELFVDNGVDAPANELAKAAAARAAAALETARRDHADLVRKRSDSQRVSGERAEADAQYKVAHLLDTLLRSSRFPEWLESAALDTLVVDASASLNELSNEQFSLTHRDGEFYVIDHADADSERSVRTLSGGETFQASLALALALSSQLSTMAVGGAAQLDSIFLDEGFGTLDPDSLELVAETLENLAKGDRMVGVITHVAALADRIPVRFTVSRDNRSSRLVREGP